MCDLSELFILRRHAERLRDILLSPAQTFSSTGIVSYVKFYERWYEKKKPRRLTIHAPLGLPAIVVDFSRVRFISSCSRPENWLVQGITCDAQEMHGLHLVCYVL